MLATNESKNEISMLEIDQGVVQEVVSKENIVKVKSENPRFKKAKDFCLQKFAGISIAKKATGALYMGGKNYFVSIQDIIMSCSVYLILFLVFISMLHTLGKITG